MSERVDDERERVGRKIKCREMRKKIMHGWKDVMCILDGAQAYCI